MKLDVEVKSTVVQSPRVLQMSGMFDVPPSKQSALRWEADLPIEDRPWNIGLICGASGSGKSTVARHLFPEPMARQFDWPKDRALLDAFPESMGIKDVIGPG